MNNPEQKGAIQRRLARIAGQVAGLQRMVDDDRYCVDICMQVAAVRSALTKVAELLLSNHVETCVADAFRKGNAAERQEKLDELFDIFGRFGKL